MSENLMRVRLSCADKLAVAKEIVAKAEKLIAMSGTPEKLNGGQRVAIAKTGDLQVMMITPFSGVKTGHGDFRYQVEMWHDKLGKVFGACWSPRERWANEFECFRLVKGEWISGFLAK